MRTGLAVWVLVAGFCASPVWAQTSSAGDSQAATPSDPPRKRPSITDAELAVLCSDSTRAEVITREPEESPTIKQLEKDIEELKAEEQRLAAPSGKQAAKQRADTQELLESKRAMREASERTLSDLRAAQPLTVLKDIVRGTDACVSGNTGLKAEVCTAYAEHRVIPWQAATTMAGCMRQATPQTAKSASALRLEPSFRGAEASRDLSGASLETAILRGTADFVIERGEEELALFAAQVMSDELCKKSTVRSLLSRTCALIADNPDDEQAKDAKSDIENKPDTRSAADKERDAACQAGGPNAPPSCRDERDDPRFAVTLAALREAARADIEALPMWLSAQLATEPKRQPLACALEVGWSFSERVLNGADVTRTLLDLNSILDRLEPKEPCQSSPVFTKKLREIVAALREVSNLDDVDVAGLVRSGNADSVVSRAAEDLTHQDALSKTGEVVREVLRRIGELQRAIAALETEPTGPRRAAVVIAALRTIEPLLEYASDEGMKASGYVTTICEIVSDIGNRDYVAAVVTLSGSELLTDALGKKRVGRNFRVLVTLGATIAQADSSDAVKAALDEAAAPLQSWRRKNVEDFGATITGMLGLTGAYELVAERTRAGRKAPNGFTLAPSLTLGVDIHGGLGGSRLGVMLSVLDLGALATVRLEESDNESGEAQAQQEPDVRFEQVLAPGLYPYFGIGPFDLGIAAGFVPSLRPARAATNSGIETLNVVRLGVFVAVDVSILPLF